MIDSKMARDISTRANDKSSEKELEKIEDAVKEAAKSGEYVVFIDHLLYPENEEHLQNLGYSIESAIDIRTNEFYTIIRW